LAKVVARCGYAGLLASGCVFWHHASMRKTRPREFNITVKRNEEGFFSFAVPGLRGCPTQARPEDALMPLFRGTIELCLAIQGRKFRRTDFVGIQRVAV
jgi:hypothetical protein